MPNLTKRDTICTRYRENASLSRANELDREAISVAAAAPFCWRVYSRLRSDAIPAFRSQTRRDLNEVIMSLTSPTHLLGRERTDTGVGPVATARACTHAFYPKGDRLFTNGSA